MLSSVGWAGLLQKSNFSQKNEKMLLLLLLLQQRDKGIICH